MNAVIAGVADRRLWVYSMNRRLMIGEAKGIITSPC